MTTPRQRLLDFAAGKGPDMIVSPLDSGIFTQSVKNLDWRLPQDSPELIEAMIQNAGECGYLPVIKFEIGSLRLLDPCRKVIEETPERKIVRSFFPTPYGEIGANVTCIEQSSHSQPDQIETKEAVRRNVWLHMNLPDWRAFEDKVRKISTLIGERALMAINIGHSFYSLGEVSELLYLHFDDPELIKDNLSVMTGYRRRIIETAASAGCRCFFMSGISRNLLSPEMIENYIVPPAKELGELVHRKGGILYLHDCGRMRQWFDRRYYQEINPDWLEGCETPPTGDIEDLHALRASLPDSIVLKGNLNLEMLRNSDKGKVIEATLNLIDSVKGHRHILGGACSILKGTSQENIRAIAETLDSMK